MSKPRHDARQRRVKDARARRRTWLGLAVLGGVAAVAAALLVAQALVAPSGLSRAAAPEHVKGAASAPVTIVEWGDFQ